MLTFVQNVDFLKIKYSKHVVVNISILLMGIMKNQDSLCPQFRAYRKLSKDLLMLLLFCQLIIVAGNYL